MRVKFNPFALLSICLIYVVLNVITFLFAQDNLASANFWVSWIITYPFSLIMMLLVFLYLNIKELFFQKKENSVLTIPGLLWLVYVFDALLVIVGTVFMFFVQLDIRVVISIEAVLAVAYLIGVLYFIFQLYSKKAE